MTPDWAAKPTAVPYATFGDPQTLNLYAYVRNNSLLESDPNGHDGLWGLIKEFLNVVEVKVTAGIQAGSSGKWGVAHYNVQGTLIGAEAKSGLGGGGAEAKVQSSATAEASAGKGPVSISASGNVHAQLSTSGGPSASASATAKVNVGPASESASATASVDGQGGHANASTSTDASGGSDSDWKIGFGVNLGVGGEVNIDFSQLGQALDDTADSLSALGSNLMDHFVTPAMNSQPPVPEGTRP